MIWPPELLKSFAVGLDRLAIPPDVRLVGLPAPVLPLLLAELARHRQLPLIAAFLDPQGALAAREALLGLVEHDSDVALYPDAPDEDSPPGFDAPLEGLRQAALARLATGEPPPFFLCTHTLLEAGLPPVDQLAAATLTVKPGEATFTHLRDWLTDNDYEPAPLVTEPGTFAVRGGVIDCFPGNLAAPVRFDFFGDQLEDIRVFDVHTQESVRQQAEVVLLSLMLKPRGNRPVQDHFPGGWLLARQDDTDTWVVSSNKSETDATPSRVDLQAEAFPQPLPGPEVLQARWELLLRQAPESQALLIAPDEKAFQRTRKPFTGIPLRIAPGAYPAGFSSASLGLFVLASAETSQRPAGAWRPQRESLASLATVRRHLDTLEPGDPIVHVNYGIGRYQGLADLPVGASTQECLAIEYANNDRVYVSTDKIGLVFPYTFEGDGAPPLDALNSRRWERVQQRTRRSAEEVVDQLAELYARRAQARGHVHADEDDLQQELEATFPYTDTPDQALAMEEIKRDMEHSRPMDRLLCGDVGFGKTELALRAAFKAVRGGYQVAIMAPTTILADQHFISFRARLQPFAVRVEMLSRFVTPARQRKTLKALAAGSADLLIGTHRLLSREVVFKRLGLLIVDEEHRFGVRQKDRLKELKTSVDVLSLSATPIPRTLHFSLAGIRDISRLDTPPLQRVPIATSVHFFSSELVKTAIRKELGRGGQVYIVHSNVKDIDRLARDLREILPDVTFGVAHGQLPARDLESTMLAFSEGRFQVLVCTSIIESGIDLPNVNTVIINNAHRFGLAQLYQIRGRVGRSNRQAYAHLLIPRRPQLTPRALKRLKTIERHSTLGSGYAIALKDLEIRGTGNLFGLEQSGHVSAVGLDLYTRIIQGIARERDLIDQDAPARRLPREDVAIRILPDARIPESYVADPHLRLNLYRRLAALDTAEDLARFHRELQDRFGALPPEVEDLLHTTGLAILAMSLGVRAVRLAPPDRLHVDFLPAEEPAVFLDQLRTLLEPMGREYRFVNLKAGDLRLAIELDRDNPLTRANQLLQGLARSAAGAEALAAV